MRFLSIALAAAFLTAPASAGETGWQEVAPGVKLRLISTGQIKAGGKTLIGVEIDMPQTTKTYWRVPGDTGFPAEFTFAGRAVTGHQVIWPYPTRDEKDGYLDYVYFGPTVLPLELDVTGDRPVVDLSLVLGVCSDICVPAQASFSLPLVDAKPDRANGLRLRQAMALAPMPWIGDAAVIGDVVYRPQEQAIAVELGTPALDIDTLIAATPGGEPVFGAPQKSREPNLVLIPVLGRADGVSLTGQDVVLTFMTDMGAFELTRVVDGTRAQ